MRIAVIGLGFMGTTHLKAWRHIPDVRLTAVCSDEPEKLSGDLSAVQGNMGGPGEKFDFSEVHKYTEVDGVLADPDVDAVDICLPTNLHSSVSIAALRAGKHVLVEKPMALDGAAADEMLMAVRDSGRVLMVGQVLRFLPPYRALRERLLSGSYGPLRTLLMRRRCAAPFWSKWLGDHDLSGGGVFDLLIHDIDYAIHLLGVPESASATGFLDASRGVDAITANLVYHDGTSVVITGGWFHRKAYPFQMEFTAVADGGTFEFASARGSGVTLYREDGETEELALPDEDAFEVELGYFAECCKTGRQPELCPPEQSAQAVKLGRLLLDARKAAGERLSVQI